MGMTKSWWRAPAVLSSLWLMQGAAVAQSVNYESDPDAERYTLHVQPIPSPHPQRATKPGLVPTNISGVTIIDAYLAAGFDSAGEDSGNEPSLAVNPLDPTQVVLLSFMGSNWAAGGNSALLYSGDGGVTWSRPMVVPPPPGTTTNINCPCDQNPEWGRDGNLYATFLHYNTNATVQSVYTAQSPTPSVGGTWTYRTSGGVAQKTNDPGLSFVDQPWIGAGPLTTDNGTTNVCVGYDNFNSSFTVVQTKAADSPGFNPLDFTRNNPTNVDGQVFNDGMNPGNRVAAGPTGILYAVYQRLVTTFPGGVKQLTYLVSASTNDGLSWSVANSDHVTGAKIVAANVFSFQGNGSKVGGVNALLGGVTAISVDPASGTAWVVYGARTTRTTMDLLYLVPVTYSSGSLLIGTPRQISPSGTNSYLPAVSVLPNGEVGVLFLTHDGAGNFSWRFVQTVDGGASIARTTTLTSFTSPFGDNGFSNQRIFGDYIQLKSVGCEFVGAFPARGAGALSVNSIVPYFMRGPAATTCNPPSLTSLSPGAVCAGGPSVPVMLNGSGFLPGATALVQGSGRSTAYVSGAQVTTTIDAGEVATPHILAVGVLNAAPAGGLTSTIPFYVDGNPPGSPGSSLRLSKGQGLVSLTWASSAGAHTYNVKRCAFLGSPCAPLPIATPMPNSYSDPVELDGNSYWYLVDSVNGCGSTP